ncbi:class I SAM-dependent methyltransferase [Mycolicibacterium neoaurum]|uniref:class I SAM-dependent methyltransferase n=1 Tax=Mycolicibacterium neoaurum TaxID=1795 RepID=UPI00267151FF|nr:class I SAM-dependent methyltransferase [Mycolicibacterium neoaurum]MDO3398684.1 class I SAM-dependent methyltransferase [Mycolicibacterium neoaurum]
MNRPTALELSRQWDAVAETRLRQITSGVDVSYRKTLLPAIQDELPAAGRVLDIGCGVGALSDAIADRGLDVVAIDPSVTNISLARENFVRPNLEFFLCAAEDLPLANHGRFDAIVSNMVLMDVVDLDRVIATSHAVSRPNAKFIATLTHPCFWPHYFGYETATWFNYNSEIFVTAPFRISNELTNINTIHVHRPLTSYFAALTRNGFRDIQLTELYGDGPFAYPRFLRLVAAAV